jgi:hypothetical protein
MMPRFAWFALLMSGGLLTACSDNAASPARSSLRVYAADVAGIAKACDAPTVAPVNGETVTVAVKETNDGGWCGVRLHQAGPKPFDAGLLTARPNHGSVLIHEVGDDTRIDYTPDRRFTGSDSFVVKLIPGDATVQVSVSVTAAP